MAYKKRTAGIYTLGCKVNQYESEAIAEELAKIFADFDAILIPAASTVAYTENAVKENKHLVFEENRYTAPASVTGLPAVVVGGVQLIGRAFSENALLDLAEIAEKEGK